MTYPDGTTVSFEYKERDQLVRIPGFFEGPVAGVWTDNAGFRYDANGFLIGLRSVNGIETTFQPDERNRLAQISSPPLTLTYAYTPGGNGASITDASSAEPFTTAYGYDGVNRLVSAQVHMPTGIETVQYRYDALGNRIQEAWTDARGAIASSYLPGNYLVQRGSTSYSWGTYGQLILKDDQPNAPGGETNYDYNARRLMTQVQVNGSPVAQFVYDAYGRRVKIVEGDTTTLTLYSGNDIVYEVRLQPGQPAVTTKYLAVGGKYLAKVVQEGTNQPQTYFYHTDLVGSVRAITDSQGQVVARFEYEPFGVTVQASGPLAGESHRFDGKTLDAAISLYYFNARYYDPVVGRFISMDQVREGLNWYLFCYANPLVLTDPTGLASMGDFRLWEAGLVVPYDREAAVAYAERYALHANPSYALEKGLPFLARWNDCTNFTSQVLKVGGIPERDAWHWGGDTYAWDWFPLPEKDHVGHTLSWVESEAFGQWLLNDPYILIDVIRVSVPTDVQSIRRKPILAPPGLQKGDIIGFRNSKEIHHWAVVTDVRDGHVYYSAHSRNRLNMLLTYGVADGDTEVLFVLIGGYTR